MRGFPAGGEHPGMAPDSRRQCEGQDCSPGKGHIAEPRTTREAKGPGAREAGVEEGPAVSVRFEQPPGRVAGAGAADWRTF